MFLSLRKNIEIIKVIKQGKRNYSRDFTVFYLENEKQEIAEIVISISKKNFKLAVERNKIRRQIKGILIETKILDNYKRYSFVVVVKSTYNVKEYSTNKERMLRNIKSIGGKNNDFWKKRQ